ncbi:MAG: hypothetical protein ACI9AR_000392, partial [Flavobacteriaceae bacterium]
MSTVRKTFSAILILVSLCFAILNIQKTEAGTLIQTKTDTATVNTTVNAVFTSTPTSGNLLVAIAGTNLSIGLNAPAGWTTAISQNGLPSQAIFYKISDGSETSVTVTSTAVVDFLGLHIYEYAGQGTIGSVNSNSETGITTLIDQTVLTGEVTTNQDNDITIGAFNAAAGISGYTSWGGEFTERTDFGNTSGRLGGGDRLSSTEGSTLEGTSELSGAGSGVTWRGQIVTFSQTTATYLKVTGGTTMDAGDSNELTITAYDSGDSVATGYTGAKTLTFSGLSDAPDT